VRSLGIDYGRRRLGLARSDEEGVLASPLRPYARGRSLDDDIDGLAALARREGVARIIIGLPLHMDGAEGEMAAEVRTFSDALRTRTGLPVDFYDERWTSLQADAAMLAGNLRRRRRRQLRDGLSATLILQGFLDRERAA